MSLGLTYALDGNAALVWVEDRVGYDEFRMIALGPRTNTLYVAFADRADVMRIVSLRRAARREVTHYGENI